MHPRAIEFRERSSRSIGFDPEIEELPSGTHTAADAAEAIGCSLEQIVKSLVMRVGDALVLVLTSGPNRVDESALAARFDVDPTAVEPADPDTVREIMGWSIGGVPPFAHDTDVPIVIDPDLLVHDEVWAGAGTPSAVFAIGPDTLVALTRAEEGAVFVGG